VALQPKKHGEQGKEGQSWPLGDGKDGNCSGSQAGELQRSKKQKISGRKKTNTVPKIDIPTGNSAKEAGRGAKKKETTEVAKKPHREKGGNFI